MNFSGAHDKMKFLAKKYSLFHDNRDVILSRSLASFITKEDERSVLGFSEAFSAVRPHKPWNGNKGKKTGWREVKESG